MLSKREANMNIEIGKAVIVTTNKGDNCQGSIVKIGKNTFRVKLLNGAHVSFLINTFNDLGEDTHTHYGYKGDRHLKINTGLES